MRKFETFEEMEVWKKARLLNVNIYRITNNEKLNRDFGLKDQIRRATVSISSNIAEGFERQSNREFIRFLYISKASAGEVRSQLYLIFDLQYITEAEFIELKQNVLEISKQISTLIKYLATTL